MKGGKEGIQGVMCENGMREGTELDKKVRNKDKEGLYSKKKEIYNLTNKEKKEKRRGI